MVFNKIDLISKEKLEELKKRFLPTGQAG